MSIYKCGRCGEKLDGLPQGVPRCPQCAYKVLYKQRDPISKKVKAR